MSKIEEAIAKIDANVAKQLVERMCKVLSIAYETRLELKCCDDMHCITRDNNEIASISIKSGEHRATGFYVDTIQHMLVFMLMPKTELSFSSASTYSRMHVDTSKMFGTSLEELLVNLDLMEAQ